MSSSSIEEIWLNIVTLLKNLNNITKNYSYFIVIVDTKQLFEKIKNKIIIEYSRERKRNKNETTGKKFNATIARINYSFKAVARLDKKTKL